MSAATSAAGSGPVIVCKVQDLVPGSGVCALVQGQQIAIFYLPDAPRQLYAISNHDPIGGAHVLSRGIVGELQGRLVVASPLYKQHYDLATGVCLEDESVSVPVYPVRIFDSRVVLD